jgi:hypothetical protein
MVRDRLNVSFIVSIGCKTQYINVKYSPVRSAIRFLDDVHLAFNEQTLLFRYIQV